MRFTISTLPAALRRGDKTVSAASIGLEDAAQLFTDSGSGMSVPASRAALSQLEIGQGLFISRSGQRLSFTRYI